MLNDDNSPYTTISGTTYLDLDLLDKRDNDVKLRIVVSPSINLCRTSNPIPEGVHVCDDGSLNRNLGWYNDMACSLWSDAESPWMDSDTQSQVICDPFHLSH